MAKKQLKIKKTPIRTCIACREARSKFDMIRVVKTSDGVVTVDITGKIRGRGANFCENLECFDKACRKGLLEISLELGRKLSDEEIEKLRNDFKEVLEEKEFRKGKKAVTLRITREKFEEIID